jgi:thiamine biosynthesis lipoprotein
MRAIMRLWAGFAGLFFVFFAACETAPKLVELDGRTMGTWYSIKYVPAAGQIDPADVQLVIDSLLNQVNQQMSTYRDSSEISLFNASADTNWFPVSAAFAEVVSIALQVSAATNGAFDITVGPLIDLWGFGRAGRIDSLPEAAAIAEQQKRIGYDKVKVRQSPAALRKTHPDVRIDLSAIAKGYGVDVIATYLQAQGTSGFMVEIGGEVRTYGSNFSKAWRIGITSPRANGRVDTVVELGNRAVATSGDYHNYIEINGKRYSHTIDPLSGRPVQHQLAAATVLDSACVWADAWATAINVLGPQAGLALAEKRKLPVLLYVREKNDLRRLASSDWRVSATEKGRK